MHGLQVHSAGECVTGGCPLEGFEQPITPGDDGRRQNAWLAQHPRSRKEAGWASSQAAKGRGWRPLGWSYTGSNTTSGPNSLGPRRQVDKPRTPHGKQGRQPGAGSH